MGFMLYILKPENLMLGWKALPVLLVVLVVFIAINFFAQKLLSNERIFLSMER